MKSLFQIILNGGNKEHWPQHCISVMRDERLKLSISAAKKLCGGRTVNRSETRTTLILDR